MRGLLMESPHPASRSNGYRLNAASEWDSVTITCPVRSPSGLVGAVTTSRMDRTVSPACPETVPSEQLPASVPWLSQNCSFRITKPIPGNSITVFGLGAALTGVPSTTSPSSSVPLALDDAPVAVAALLDLDFTSVALIPHPVGVGRRHTPAAWAKLAAVLVSVVSVPLLSLCEAPAPTAPGISTSSRF